MGNREQQGEQVKGEERTYTDNEDMPLIGVYQEGLSDEEIIQRFSSLVHKIAHNLYRYLKKSAQLEDMIADGMTGLLAAHRRYDDEYACIFSTYAYYRIRGEILDGCRRAGADIRRNRALRELLSINEFLEANLSNPDHPARTFSDCVTGLRTMVGDATILYHLRRAALYAPTPAIPHQRRRIEYQNLQNQIQDAFNQLNAKEQKVMRRYYFEEANMHDIAQDLGISKSWVSRIHARAITRLRRILLENEEFCDNHDIIRV